MSYAVFPSPPEHYAWLGERTGCEMTAGFRAIEAQDGAERYCRLCGRYHGRIVGMVGYSGWTPNSVGMHLALDKPAAIRALLQHGFRYAFVQAEKQLVIGVTPGDNDRALKLNRHLGFRETYRVRDAWKPGVDLVIQELRRDDCRWLKGEDRG